MKRSIVRGHSGHTQREPPPLEEIFGITESGRGWIALFVVVLVLALLLLAFFLRLEVRIDAQQLVLRWGKPVGAA